MRCFRKIRRLKRWIVFANMFLAVVVFSLSRFTTKIHISPVSNPVDEYTTSVIDRLEEKRCIVPDIDPFDDQVKGFYKKVTHYNCFGAPSFLEVTKDNMLRVNEDVLKKQFGYDTLQYCLYHAIERTKNLDKQPDDVVNYVERPNSKFRYSTNITDDFIRVFCYDKEGQVFFRDYKALIQIKPDVEERCQKSKAKGNGQKLNVLVFAIDSISRLNFLRHFPKTYDLLLELGAIEYKSYNKVGDSTLDNMMPLLTGQFLDSYWNESMISTFDHIDLIWKYFSDKGYRTLFAEDAPEFGMFNYEKIGFRNPPTDYYFRPFASATEYSDKRRRSRHHCLGDQMEFKIVLDWTAKFLRKFKDSMYFAWTFITRFTHNELNYAGYADEPTYAFFKEMLKDEDILKNSVVVFMSDHGIRY